MEDNKSKVTKRLQKQFCEVITSSGSLNFPAIALDLKLSWTKDILPALREDIEFRTDFQEALECVKYSLIEDVAFLARTGRTKRQVDISSVNATLRYLDINTILQAKAVKAALKQEEEAPEKELTEEEIQQRLAQLNIPTIFEKE